MPEAQTLFPEFERFAAATDLVAKSKGALSAKLPRVLGQGSTRAKGLDLPPAPIERRQELISLGLPPDVQMPETVVAEIHAARRALESEWDALTTDEGRRRVAVGALRLIEQRHHVEIGKKDNQYFAGRLVLTHSKNGRDWAWGITPYYPVIAKIPADLEYVAHAYASAEKAIEALLLPADRFEHYLDLAWLMARHFSPSDDVLIVDVGRMFQIAVQDETFWNRPLKQNFRDVPDGAFVASLIHWRRSRPDGGGRFEFVPATLNQAHGPNARPFHLPANPEGTQTRPMIYLRRRAKPAGN
jgi:hypothetical protein